MLMLVYVSQEFSIKVDEVQILDKGCSTDKV